MYESIAQFFVVSMGVMWYYGVYMVIKFLIVLVTAGILTLGFACTGTIGHTSTYNAPMNSAMVMSIDNQECCNAGISKHIESWKRALLLPPREVRDALLSLALALVAAFVSACRRVHFFNDRRQLFYGLYTRDNPDLTLFNHLKLAFARGVLNPKIY